MHEPCITSTTSHRDVTMGAIRRSSQWTVCSLFEPARDTSRIFSFSVADAAHGEVEPPRPLRVVEGGVETVPVGFCRLRNPVHATGRRHVDRWMRSHCCCAAAACIVHTPAVARPVSSAASSSQPARSCSHRSIPPSNSIPCATAVTLEPHQRDCKLTQDLRAWLDAWHTALGQHQVGQPIDVDRPLLARRRIAHAQFLPV